MFDWYDSGNYCKCVLSRREGIVPLVDSGNYCKCILTGERGLFDWLILVIIVNVF